MKYPRPRRVDHAQDVASSIDIQAYLRGDFKGGGKRDLPVIPEYGLRPDQSSHP